ncbi:uncharacterized protein LOC143285282 [Babylonia areolata]|uniref:uncharacterized protein LOC143285282 n=1 Tax=Babylonia areolata TaxID=304850 RepID=UPI003FD42B88
MESEAEDSLCRIDRELGSGSFGNVYCLSCSQSPHGSRTKYALKVVDERGVGAQDQAAAHKELRIMRGLHHPAVVTLVDSFQVHHRLLLVLELCEAGDLRHHLDCLRMFWSWREEEGREGVGEEESLVVHWTLQLTDGLQYLHHKKILHRDLKPQNIFLKDKYSVKIGDLGIARQLVFTKEMAATHIGTPLYISPEIYQGNAYSYKTDIWSLGCCVYEMMTLQYAFHAPSRYQLVGKVVTQQVQPLPDSYGRSLRSMVLSMLCKDPDQRPDAKELLASLQELDTEHQKLRWQSRKNDTEGDRWERPRDARSLQAWRLNMARALTQFLSEKQALQCAQLSAALAQRLTVDSVRDISQTSGQGDPPTPAPSSSSRRRRGRSHMSSQSSISGTLEEGVEGVDATRSASSTQSGRSDMSVSCDSHTTEVERSYGSTFESTLGDSQTLLECWNEGIVNRSRHHPGSPSAQYRRQDRQDKHLEEDSDDSDSESEDSQSETVVPSSRVKIGKSSMVVRARPSPHCNRYTKHSANSVENSLDYEDASVTSASASPMSQNSASQKEAASSQAAVNSSQTHQSASSSHQQKAVDMAYANDVLQWARARLLPPSPQDGPAFDYTHCSVEEAENGGTGTAPSAVRDSATKKRGRKKKVVVQEEAGEEDETRGSSQPGVTNGLVKKMGGVEERTGREGGERATAARLGDQEEADRQTGAAGGDADRAEQGGINQEKGRKKKKNFLRDRKMKEVQDKATDDPQVSGKATSQDAQVHRPTVGAQKEQGVTLYTRAQLVTFLSLQADDMDLSIGGESEPQERQIVGEVGEARLRAAVGAAVLLPHNPSLLELQLREILGRENYKKYAAAVVRMAESRITSVWS